MIHQNKGCLRAVLPSASSKTFLTVFLIAVFARPMFHRAWFQLGAALNRSGRSEEAAEAVRHAIRLGRTFASAYRLLAECYESLGDQKSAAIAYAHAFQLGDRSPDCCLKLAWLQSVSLEVAVRNGPQALQLASMAHASRSSVRSLVTLAAASAECGEFEKAVHYQMQAIDKALARHPDDTVLNELKSILEGFRSNQPVRLPGGTDRNLFEAVD
ncbi:MAG: hypothetical protein R3C49_11700 [Planctomycetaceae bacterium]